MVNRKSTADVRERFQKQAITAGKDTANKTKKALTNTGQRAWYVVDKNGWDGSLRGDAEGMGKPFSRDEHKEDIANTYKVDGDNAGGFVGDMVVSALQGDYLGTQERAFRARHHSRVQATLQSAGRKYGHGHEAGILERGVLGYVQGISKVTKGTA
jgi:hypothetical protein